MTVDWTFDCPNPRLPKELANHLGAAVPGAEKAQKRLAPVSPTIYEATVHSAPAPPPTPAAGVRPERRMSEAL